MDWSVSSVLQTRLPAELGIDKSAGAIEFYEYSSLYDRNQFVCVLRNEYGDLKQSGCLEKKTGKIRCWCYGRSNCNSAEDSKKLYEAFKSGDQERFREVVEEIDFPNLHNDDPNLASPTTQLSKTTEKPEKLGPRYSSDSKTESSGVLKINNLPTDSHKTSSKSQSRSHHHKSGHKKHHHPNTTTSASSTTTTTEKPIFKERIYKTPIVKAVKEQSAFIPVPANSPSFSKPIVRPPPNHFDTSTSTNAPTTESNVKVIYVNSKDKYQNVIGSDEFRKALHLDKDEPDEAHLLPTDQNNKKKPFANRNVDPFNTEYNEEDSLENEDPLAELPMSDQEADVYLSDEARIPRVKARSKDLDEYSSSSAYYDSAIGNSATTVLQSMSLFALSVWMFLM
ncbi:hypothetical protein M3Y97_00415200 [Aphelenchoides bicaudatus]|nr:hypothetical protein M3Y97_00415200 [Aphelenchoides bicaudatus]